MSLVAMFVLICTGPATAMNLQQLLANNSDSQKESIAQCILFISKEHLFKSTTIIYDEVEQRNDSTNLLNAILNILANNVPFTITKDLNAVEAVTDSRFLTLVFYNNCKLLMHRQLKFIEKLFYLIIIEQHFSQCKEILTKLNRMIWTSDVTLLFFDSAGNKHIFISLIPDLDGNTCTIAKEVKLVQINVCYNGLLENTHLKNIFPSKVTVDYKKCPFRVGLATLFPYSIIQNKDNLTDLDLVHGAQGSDVEILKIITENINATLDLYYVFREEETPFLHQEYVNYLINGTLDACAGGLYRIYGNVVDYSGIYSSQTVDWAYYVERDVRSWQSLVSKFKSVYLFFIFYIIYSLVWKLISEFDHHAVSFMDVFLYSWGALVGTNSLLEARSYKKKVLNIFYLTMCLYLSAYISAQIYSYLTITGPPIFYKTNDELRESDKTPYLRYSSKFFVNDKKYELFANTSRDCADFYDCFMTIIKNKGCTVILDSYLIKFQALTATNDEVRVLSVSESILTVYHEMIIRRKHPLTKKYRSVVETLFETGICQKLYHNAIGMTTVYKSEIFNKNILSNSYSCTVGCAITFAQFAGAFYLWVVGCLFSVFIFVIEKISPNATRP